MCKECESSWVTVMVVRITMWVFALILRAVSIRCPYPRLPVAVSSSRLMQAH